MLLVCPLRLAESSHVIDSLHVERNKVDVSSHLLSSLYLFRIPINLRCIVYEQPSYMYYYLLYFLPFVCLLYFLVFFILPVFH